MNTGRTETVLSPAAEVTSSVLVSLNKTPAWRVPTRRIIFVLCVATLTTAMLARPATGYPRIDSHHRQNMYQSHHLSKRSFFDIQCKGVYDKSIFARLERICEDCYNLFREPQLHTLCTNECFTTDFFKGCMDALQLSDETDQIQTWIKQLHGADPKV